jgi:hypothetical protein
MQSVTAGAYPGPGINLGPAIVFAYAAVKAAQRTARDDGDERTSWSQPPVGAIVSQTLEES